MYENEWEKCSKLEIQLREQYKQNAEIFIQLLEKQMQVHMRNEEVSKQNELLNKDNMQRVFEEVKREIITKLMEDGEADKKEMLEEGYLLDNESFQKKLLIEKLKEEIVQLKNQLAAYEKKWEEHNEINEKRINLAIDAFNKQIKDNKEAHRKELQNLQFNIEDFKAKQAKKLEEIEETCRNNSALMIERLIKKEVKSLEQQLKEPILLNDESNKSLIAKETVSASRLELEAFKKETKKENENIHKIINNLQLEVDKLVKQQLQPQYSKKAHTTKDNTEPKQETARQSNKLTRNVIIKLGDIVQEEVDVIVNAANMELLHNRGVAAAINKASGGIVQKQSKNCMHPRKLLSTGSAVATLSGGALKCKYIIHAVGPIADIHVNQCDELLKKACAKAMEIAKTLGTTSIAFPPISSGRRCGVQTELVADVMLSTLCSFTCNNPPVLTDVRIVIIDKPTFDVFMNVFRRKQKSLEQAHNSSPAATRDPHSASS